MFLFIKQILTVPWRKKSFNFDINAYMEVFDFAYKWMYLLIECS